MIIWLTSYSKSGNTLWRSTISTLLYSEDGIKNFKYLFQIDIFPVLKFFKKYTSNLVNLNEINKYSIKSQNEINLNKNIKKTLEASFLIEMKELAYL